VVLGVLEVFGTALVVLGRSPCGVQRGLLRSSSGRVPLVAAAIAGFVLGEVIVC
jgi:hypothetical protein